jgi:antagonist of KipI
MGSILVVRPGLLTSVQDLGRWGFQWLGVPVAGAMDLFSHRLANMLVGNDGSAATLEVTLAGPELVFSDARLVAMAGAVFEISVNGQSVATADRFVVPEGGVLRFGRRVTGARAYLAVGGGIGVPSVLGSRSTYLAGKLGGYFGRMLVAGDRVPLEPPPERSIRRMARRSEMLAPAIDGRVRVVSGPQADRFSDDALDTLQSRSYRLLPDSGRMALRLAGPRLRHAHGAAIISDATPPGTLQVPPSGQPILLMADRPTTGGYAKLATVISADLGKVAQAAPGDSLTFTVCSQAEALAAMIAQERALLALEVGSS